MYGMIGDRSAYLQQEAAKQVRDRQEVYSTGVEPQQNIMGLVSRVAETQGGRINDMLVVISMFLDRIFGPQPADQLDAAAPGDSKPRGALQEIERSMSRNDALLGELEHKIRRLSEIA